MPSAAPSAPRPLAVELAIALAVFTCTWAGLYALQLSPRLHLRYPAPWGGVFIATAVACLVLIALLMPSRRILRAELIEKHAINLRLLHSEQEAREAELRSRLLLESTSDGIYALDPEGRFLWLNPAAVRLFGYGDATELIGRRSHPTIHHTHPDGTPFPEEECQSLMSLHKADSFVQPQELLWRADGTSFYAEIHVNPIRHEGRHLGSVTAFRDLTEQLRLEEQYRHAHKMEAVGRLAAGLSHDFNNLLTVIIGYTEMLRQEQDQGSASARRLAGIERAGYRAAELVRQLLAYSRNTAPDLTELSLSRLLETVEPALQALLGAERDLHLTIAPGLAIVCTDFHQIEEVLRNLVSNARDAMPTGGTVELRAENCMLSPPSARTLRLEPGAYVRIEIADSGVGMDAETQKHIFEPFFSTKPPSQGAGLGLAMALDAVRKCGGSIAVDSALGRGTSVQLYLPVHDSAKTALVR